MTTNPFPRKLSLRKFGSKLFYYIGRTQYWSKADLEARTLRDEGMSAKVTQREGWYLIWATQPVWVDLSEPGWNPTSQLSGYVPLPYEYGTKEARDRAIKLLNMMKIPSKAVLYVRTQTRGIMVPRRYKEQALSILGESGRNPIIEGLLSGVGVGLGFFGIKRLMEGKMCNPRGKITGLRIYKVTVMGRRTKSGRLENDEYFVRERTKGDAAKWAAAQMIDVYGKPRSILSIDLATQEDIERYPIIFKKFVRESENPAKPHTEVKVPYLPKCDFCSAKAQYDGKTGNGPWAYMCRMHFVEFGVGLGLGKGQRLVVRK